MELNTIGVKIPSKEDAYRVLHILGIYYPDLYWTSFQENTPENACQIIGRIDFTQEGSTRYMCFDRGIYFIRCHEHELSSTARGYGPNAIVSADMFCDMLRNEFNDNLINVDDLLGFLRS